MTSVMRRRDFLRQATLAGSLALSLGASASWAAEVLARAPDPGAQPGLDEGQRALLAAIAEAIIPATDTPGAIGAGVPQFLELLYREWFLPAEQTQFIAGLAALDQRCRATTGLPLSQGTSAQQLELVRQWDAEAAGARQAGQPLPFFARLRSLVLIGYYTSEVGQVQELKVRYGGGADQPGGPVFGAPVFKV